MDGTIDIRLYAYGLGRRVTLRGVRTALLVLGRGLRFSPFELSLSKLSGFGRIGPRGY